MAFLTTTLIGLGVLLIYWGWTKKDRLTPPFLLSGWGALFLGLFLWGDRFADSGVAIGASAGVIAAFAVLGAAALRAAKADRDHRTGKMAQNVQRGIRPVSGVSVSFASAALAIFVTGGIALALGLASMRAVLALGGSEPDAIMTAYAVVPVSWAMIASCALIAPAGKTRIILLSAAALAPVAYLGLSG